MQAAFRDCHGLQCGFCTPGFVVSVTAFLRDHPDPTDEEIREALSGNLCRCTGYQGIVEAVRQAADAARGGARMTQSTAPGAARYVGHARRPRSRTRGCSPADGTYVDDVTLPGMLHACFVRSPFAAGRDPRHRHRGRARPARASASCSPPPT